ncbi:response regulator [Minwuia thermotolerans]|uniref:Response regulatory domain-containing protein n=1 Tax=Minwuia thermotolerans TaxID=2056226 RepID=A0A2M9FW77_9PROT|nr:response regulator [Minwuia thermotolerans]PJK27725.1 hypothetical protein CVT23_20765 [Minwuia thermotolerans]
MRVLVVDDSQANRSIARVLLENAGHRVMEADGGEAAVAAASEFLPDVILMDVAMPGMDGLEATRAIRRLEGDVGTTPVVAWTAHDIPGMRRQTSAAGMNAYLTKPVVRQTLIATIAAFGRSRGPNRFDAVQSA